MKKTINLYDFRADFMAIRPENFSYVGLETLFNYLEEYEDSTGEQLEFDVIRLCCDFSEDTWQNIADNYSIDLSDCESDEDKEEAVREYLEDEGALVGESSVGSYVYRNI